MFSFILQEKRLKAKEIQRLNVTPHRLSRGGYDLLTQRMMEEKARLRETELASSGLSQEDLPPPSPPKRHQKWKRARQKPSGDMTSEEARHIAERIVSYYSLKLIFFIYHSLHLSNNVLIFIVGFLRGAVYTGNFHSPWSSGHTDHCSWT